MRLLRPLILFAMLGVAPSTAHALRCNPACSCVSGAAPPFEVRLRAEGVRAKSQAALDSTMAFEVTLAGVSSIDTVIALGLSGPRHRTMQVEHFTVQRAWALYHGDALPRALEQLSGPIYMCPRPKWETGKRYLVFARVFEGRIVLDEDCFGTTYPLRENRTRRAVRALNATWVRR